MTDNIGFKTHKITTMPDDRSSTPDDSRSAADDSNSDDQLDQLLSRLRPSRFPTGIQCPRCGERRHSRWGTFRCRQRYRCARCRRTYSDLTGTPAAYVKKLHLWPEFAGLLASGVTVRHAAAVLGVHPTTTFRWRHTLLRALVERDEDCLTGWIEIATRRFAHSEKGARRLRRPPRKRGYRPRSTGDDRTVHVLAAVGRQSGYASVITTATTLPPDRNAHQRLLSGRIVARSLILARGGRFSAAARVARSLGCTFRDARPSGKPRAHRIDHVETASACLDRLRFWLRRFRGVATRYLLNYLMWHRLADRSMHYAAGEWALQWPGDAAID